LRRVDVVISSVIDQKSFRRDTVVLDPTIDFVGIRLFSCVLVNLVERPFRRSRLDRKHCGGGCIVGGDVDVAKPMLICISKTWPSL
jgi:hypothetical protein